MTKLEELKVARDAAVEAYKTALTAAYDAAMADEENFDIAYGAAEDAADAWEVAHYAAHASYKAELKKQENCDDH